VFIFRAYTRALAYTIISNAVLAIMSHQMGRFWLGTTIVTPNAIVVSSVQLVSTERYAEHIYSKSDLR